MEVTLPPGFLFPVKEQVACMKDLLKDPSRVLFLSISDGYLTRGFTNLKKTYIMLQFFTQDNDRNNKRTGAEQSVR
jgi:hypothetical protein